MKERNTDYGFYAFSLAAEAEQQFNKLMLVIPIFLVIIGGFLASQ